MSANQTNKIEKLKSEGYKLRVSHLRYWVGACKRANPVTKWVIKDSFSELDPRGGKTVVNLVKENGPIKVSYEAEALCSRKDGYCKKSGIEIALQRLENALS